MPTMTTSAFPLIKVVDIPGKGKGVVALETFPKGTRILSEKPRIRLSDLRDIDSLLSLSEGDLYFFLSFPSHGENEENPVQSRLKHFLPCVGSVDNAFGLFETICRVNHTCYSPLGRPNALFMWREDLKEEILTATEDIVAMEEITVSYLQYNIHTEDPSIYLRRKFGFECSCLGCLRPASARQKSVERIQDFRQFTDSLPARMALGGLLGDPPKSLLDSIEKYILMICAEGYVWQLGSSAHDAFQLCAFYGDADSASKWEALARDSHEILQGADSPAYKKSEKLAALPRTFREWKVLGSQKLSGPSKQVLAYLHSEPKSLESSSIKVVPAAFPHNTVAQTGTASDTANGQKTNSCSYSSCLKKEPSDSSVRFSRCKPCLEKTQRDVRYCSVSCQRADWKLRHKAVCGRPL